MQDGLIPAAHSRVKDVRVRISGQQGGLEEQHAGGPDGGRASEPRQNHPRDHRLDLEEQERGNKNRGGV